MTTYRERHLAGIHDANQQPVADEEPDPDNLPGRHAALDELATARGLIWSNDNLSVADKQAELAAHLTANVATTTSDDLTGLQA
jgi:hypothetical protein